MENDIPEEPLTPEQIRANNINKRFRSQTKYIQSQTDRVIYFACLYIAHIKEGNPKSYQYFCKKYNLKKKRLYKYVKKITLDLEIDISTPIEVRVKNIINQSRESAIIKTESIKLLETMIRKGFQFRGKYTATIGALFYIVKNRYGSECSLTEIAQTFHVDQGVLKKHRDYVLRYI